MKVKELIKELEKLPPDIEITFEDYDHSYSAEVRWDITREEYEEGYSDEPYIWLTQ
jgi:hypothetical protein